LFGADAAQVLEEYEPMSPKSTYIIFIRVNPPKIELNNYGGYQGIDKLLKHQHFLSSAEDPLTCTSLLRLISKFQRL